MNYPDKIRAICQCKERMFWSAIQPEKTRCCHFHNRHWRDKLSRKEEQKRRKSYQNKLKTLHKQTLWRNENFPILKFFLVVLFPF